MTLTDYNLLKIVWCYLSEEDVLSKILFIQSTYVYEVIITKSCMLHVIPDDTF